MTDIIDFQDNDLVMFDTEAHRAANILAVQLGSLEYEPTFGIDLSYFLTESIQFQNGSFVGYIVEQLANRGINVTNVIDTVQDFGENYDIKISPNENSTGFVTR